MTSEGEIIPLSGVASSTPAAQAILNLLDHPAPPAHLLLGSDALQQVRDKLRRLESSIAEWESVTRSTDG